MIAEDADDILNTMVVVALWGEILDHTPDSLSLLRRSLWAVDSVRSAMLERDYERADDEVRRLLNDRNQLLQMVG